MGQYLFALQKEKRKPMSQEVPHGATAIAICHLFSEKSSILTPRDSNFQLFLV
jgi:hypothetical protein